MLEEFSNDPDKFEYYQSRHCIQMAELSVATEHQKIRDDYASAIKQLDSAVESRDQLVKTLLAYNTMSIKQISQATGLSIEQIKTLEQ